ncbi:MAG: multidrug efflux transporter permease subunit [Verrucomicrobiaceae bacterium]|nr:multidrug efflux transporter permease subunit [Verrucomicrobiaceae bacterium]
MINFFIDRPIFATVLAIIITFGGAVALTQLPIARFPQITPPTIVVSTSFPGADAATIEQSVAAPIEQQVNGVPNMLYMDSKSSNDGNYSLTITFAVGTDQDIAAVNVQNQVAIAQRQLPQQVLQQGVVVAKRQPSILLFVALRAKDPRYDYLFLSNYATLHVYDALARIPGVGQVVVLGARDYGMRIWLDPEKMAQLGVTTQDVNAVIGEQNVVAPAGTIGGEPAPKGQQLQYNVNVKGRLTSVAEYQNIIVRARNDGTSVRLNDIARVELAATDYGRSSRLSGEPVATIAIYQLPNANALDVSRRAHQVIKDLAPTLPPGIIADIPFDTTNFVSESLHEVVITLIIAVLLVLVVVFVFLENWRATLIPMLAVPVSLIGTFVAFLVLGFSINTLTLFALVLAIGLVVDDAIVVVEAVTAKMDHDGLDAVAATRAAMSEVAGPVVAIALVLTSVFIPVAFIGGLSGQFYKQFALTLAVSVAISAFVALTFTPALCALLLRPTEDMPPRGVLGRFFNGFNRVFKRSTDKYVSTVGSAIRRWPVTVVIFILLAGAAAWLMATRPAGFLPDEDQGYLLSIVTLPPAASLQRTEAVMAEYQKILAKYEEVENTLAITGFSGLTGVNSPNTATMFLILKPWGDRKAVASEIVARLNKDVAQLRQAQVLVLNPPSVAGIGSAGGFEFVLEDRGGDDIDKFSATLSEFLADARKHSELGMVSTQYNGSVPQIEYVIDRDRTKTLGVKISDVFSSLQMFLGGSYINDFNLYGRTYKVTAQAEAVARATPDAVNNLFVRTERGDMTPLSTMVTIKPKSGPLYIERYNVFRAATINGAAAPGFSSGQAAQAMEAAAANLPAGYSFEWSGTTYQEKIAGGQAPYIFALALLFVFLVLAAQYESWVVPFAVLFGIPFAALGAFGGLALRGMANDIYAQIGMVMLIGLAAKNAILIVEFARLSHQRGMALVDAAIEGARLRLRPILMTSFAFVLGSVPLAVASGAGSGARRVLGTAVVAGMTVATMIGIFMVPVFYVLIQGGVERLQARRAKPAASEHDAH